MCVRLNGFANLFCGLVGLAQSDGQVLRAIGIKQLHFVDDLVGNLAL